VRRLQITHHVCVGCTSCHKCIRALGVDLERLLVVPNRLVKLALFCELDSLVYPTKGCKGCDDKSCAKRTSPVPTIGSGSHAVPCTCLLVLVLAGGHVLSRRPQSRRPRLHENQSEGPPLTSAAQTGHCSTMLAHPVARRQRRRHQ